MMFVRIVTLLLGASTCADVAFAADPSVKAVLGLSPVMEGINIEIPEAEQREALKVRRIENENATGWQLVTNDRAVLRCFLDTNGDKKVDRWIDFLHGREVYRDADTDYDGIADLAVQRFQLKENEQGKLVVASGDKPNAAPTGEHSQATKPTAGRL